MFKGLLKIAGGFVLASIVPAALGTTIYVYSQQNKDYLSALDQVKETTQFQQVYDNQKNYVRELKDKADRGEISYNDVSDADDYLNSNDFVVDYAKGNNLKEYEAMEKFLNSHVALECGMVASSVAAALELLVMDLGFASDKMRGLNYMIASGVDDVKAWRETRSRQKTKEEQEIQKA